MGDKDIVLTEPGRQLDSDGIENCLDPLNSYLTNLTKRMESLPREKYQPNPIGSEVDLKALHQIMEYAEQARKLISLYWPSDRDDPELTGTEQFILNILHDKGIIKDSMIHIGSSEERKPLLNVLDSLCAKHLVQQDSEGNFILKPTEEETQ